MIVLALFGVLLMVIAMPAGKKEEKEERTAVGRTKEEKAQEDGSPEYWEREETQSSYAAGLEERLEKLLFMMDGVGKAEVMVTLEGSGERIVEKDEPGNSEQLTEEDSAGGKRENRAQESRETTVYRTDTDGAREPYVKKKLEPKVTGVTVVAEGGGSLVVQKNITDVMQALFGIEPHKIKVVKMK